MRKALSPSPSPVQMAALMKSAGAPTGGLNSRDSLAAMKPEDALMLENIICRSTYVETRSGQEDFVTGFPTDAKVKALMPYRDGSVDKLFAATDTAIYDVTSTGTLGAAVAPSTNGYWISLNSANAGIRYLLAVNGVDGMKFYDGTSWTDAAITGLDSTTITNISQFKFRVFMLEAGTLSFWYLAVNAVQGAATEFPLGPVFSKGGSLLACASWTLDGGNGSDDYAVFITTEGEVAIYRGIDPSDADNFALVGVYNLPRPIGKKCLYKFGGDLLVITEEGLIELSRSLQSVAVEKTASITDKNQGNISAATKLYKGNAGWELTHLSAENLLILNVPTTEWISSFQYVMNTTTGAWSSFTNMNANCFVEFGARLFYGTTEKVVYALSAERSDFGANITATMQTAYNFFGSKVAKKFVTLMKPMLTVSKQTSLSFALSPDFQTNNYLTQSSVGSNGLSLFDVSLWDQSYWVGGLFSDLSWRTVTQRPATCFSTLMRVNDKNLTFQWHNTDYLVKPCGPVS